MSSRRESLPGDRVRRCLVVVVSPRAMESVFDPFLADLQADWLDARSRRSASQMRLRMLGAYLSLALQVATFAIGSIFGPSYELAPAASSGAPPVDGGAPAGRASRYGAPLVIAALITFGLFAVMSALIATQPGQSTGAPSIPVTWARVQDDPEPVAEPDPVLPVMPDPIPFTPKGKISIAESGETRVVLPREPGGGWTGAVDPYITGPVVRVPGADQSEIPIVRVEPIYPRRALARGIEGWVEVEFTVTEVGSISDPTILRSEPRGVFDRAAVRAIERWKYEPKIVDGRPVSRPGMRNRFRFQID